MNILMGAITPNLYLFRTDKSIFVMTLERVLKTSNSSQNEKIKFSSFTKEQLYEFISSYYNRETVFIESFFCE